MTLNAQVFIPEYSIVTYRMQKRTQTTTKRAKKVPKVTITGQGALIDVGSAKILKKVAFAMAELTSRQPQGNQHEADH